MLPRSGAILKDGVVVPPPSSRFAPQPADQGVCPPVLGGAGRGAPSTDSSGLGSLEQRFLPLGVLPLCLPGLRKVPGQDSSQGRGKPLSLEGGGSKAFLS